MTLPGRTAALWVAVAASCATPVGKPPPPTPARAEACDTLSEVRHHLAAGRITRATGALPSVREDCRPRLGDDWGELVLALVELGREGDARAEAHKVQAAADASAGAKAVARRAIEHLTRHGPSGGDLPAMLGVYDRALEAEREGKQEAALSGYLDAWSRFRPNPQALVRAGRVASSMSRPALAQRYYDRALAEHGRAGAKSVSASARTFDEVLESARIAWLGEDALALCYGSRWQILSVPGFELLFELAASRTIFSDDGRHAAFWHEYPAPHLDVRHPRSGHLVASFPTAPSVSAIEANATFSRVATVNADGAVEVFDVSSKKRVAHFTASEYPNDVAFVGETTLWVSAQSGREQHAFDIASAKPLWHHQLTDVERSDRLGERVVLSRRSARGKRSELVTLDLTTGRFGTPTLVESNVDEIAVLGPNLVVTASENGVLAYDLERRKRIGKRDFPADERPVTLHDHGSGSVRVTTHPGRSQRRTFVWEPSGDRLEPYVPKVKAMEPNLFGTSEDTSPRGRIAYLPDLDSVVVRELDGRESKVERARPAELAGVAAMPDGSGVVLGHESGIRTVSWKPRALGWLGAPGLSGANLGFSPDGGRLLSTGERMLVLDAKTGAVVHSLDRGGILDARLTRTGDAVVALTNDEGLVWNLSTSTADVRSHESEEEFETEPMAAATCCDGQLTVGLRPSMFTSDREPSYAGARAISADGARVALGFYGPTPEGDESTPVGVRVIEVSTKKVVATLELASTAREVALDRSGERLAAAAGIHAALSLFHVATQKRFELGSGWELSFSRDGSRVVALNREGARIWRATDGSLLGSILISRADGAGAAFVDAQGRVDWLGKPGGVHLTCQVGDTHLPFEVCADRLVSPGAMQRVLAR